MAHKFGKDKLALLLASVLVIGSVSPVMAEGSDGTATKTLNVSGEEDYGSYGNGSNGGVAGGSTGGSTSNTGSNDYAFGDDSQGWGDQDSGQGYSQDYSQDYGQGGDYAGWDDQGGSGTDNIDDSEMGSAQNYFSNGVDDSDGFSEQGVYNADGTRFTNPSASSGGGGGGGGVGGGVGGLGGGGRSGSSGGGGGGGGWKI